MTLPDLTLDLDRAARVLATAAVGHTLDYHPQVESTMPIAQHLALRPDIRSGTVVLAEEQSAGRGRLQRRWDAPPGQALLLSILIKHGQLPTSAGHLPMLAGLAVLNAVRRVANLDGSELRIGLKWPNDVLLGRSPADARKLAGILIEASMQNGMLQHAVVGIGLNVNQSTDALPTVEPPAPLPTSLYAALGRPVDRTDLLIALCRSFSDQLTRPAPMLVAEWRRDLWTLGHSVTVHQIGGAILQGIALDITESGALIVQETASGALRTVEAGDVSLRAPALPTGDSVSAQP